MKTMHLIANPASPHLRSWIDCLPDDIEVVIWNIGEKKSVQTIDFENKSLPVWTHRFPKPVRYILLGLWMRFFLPPSCWCHAHNTSGYGVAALVSGRRYVITTFGSEILTTEAKSKFYWYLISRVLKAAQIVTTSSIHMRNILLQDLNVPLDKIVSFSPGVASVFNLTGRSDVELSKPKVWFSNRRMMELYNINAIVEAFILYKKQGGLGSLILLQGDALGDYADGITQLAATHSYIKVINEFISLSDMADLLRSVDFTVSIPETDQLSATLIEAMACGALPITSDIPAYEELSEFVYKIPLNTKRVANLLRMFRSTSQLSRKDLNNQRLKAVALVNEAYSNDHAKRCYAKLCQIMAKGI